MIALLKGQTLVRVTAREKGSSNLRSKGVAVGIATFREGIAS